MPHGLKVTELSGQSVALLRQDWEQGFLPVKVLSLKYGVDIEDLRATAKRERWLPDRDEDPLPEARPAPLPVELDQAATEANVLRVVSDDDREQGRTDPRVMDRTATVRQFGMVVAGVQSEHRTVIKRARLYVTSLLDQLEQLVGPRLEKERIQALARLIGDGDAEFSALLLETPAAGDMMGELKLMDKKSTVVTKLTIALKDLIALERAAYGLDKQGGAVAGYDELLDAIHEQRKKR